MSKHQGQFVWYELMTSDLKAAEAFYRTAIGWETRDSGLANIQYTILHAGDVGVGGMVAYNQAARDAGARPGWVGYIGSDDVDDMAARVQQASGSLHRGPEDIPHVGRFAVVADPQGAKFTLFTPLPGGPEPPPAGATPGRIGWHELHALDWPPAFDFYAGLFGWTKTQAVDMGPMGTYQTFATAGASGEAMTGGMMTNPASGPNWLYYFNVDRVDPAVERVKGAGGTVLNGPHEVPGGSWIVQCRDPQGAMFAMVGPSR